MTSSPVQSNSEYFTPPHYAHLAHRYLHLATFKDQVALYDRNWWDAACGAGQLTQPCPVDMKGMLFTSSFNPLDVGRVVHASLTTSFSFDFQRQPDSELPSNLLQALKEDRHWVMIGNPPFEATTTARGARNSGIRYTYVAAQMADDRLKRAAHISSLQFMYRIWDIVGRNKIDAVIGVFTQPTFLNSENYKAFLNKWLERFEFVSGFVVNGKEFGTPSKDWPLSYTVWRTAKGTRAADRTFQLDEYINGECIGKKTFSPCTRMLSKWIVRPKATVPVAPLTSALNVCNKGKVYLSKLPPDALGFVSSSGNDVMHSRGSFLLSSAYANGNGWGVTPDIFENSLVALAVRCLVRPNWRNDRDLFNVPDKSIPGFDDWSRSAIVWLIASVYNSTSSFIAHYQGKDFDISNQFFWMLPADVAAITELPEIIRENAATALPPFFAQWHQQQVLAGDAECVLSLMTQLVYETAALRRNANPSLHLDRWDAGWYQIRHGFFRSAEQQNTTEKALDLYQELKRSHRILGASLAKGVYEFGFLVDNVD